MTNTASNWKTKANCYGVHPSVMYTDDPGYEGTKAKAHAKAICKGCPVFENCVVAGAWELDGIWFGTDEKERIQIRHNMRRHGLDPLEAYEQWRSHAQYEAFRAS